MKILHLLDSFEMGGAQQVALLLAEHQAANGFHDVVVAGSPGPLISEFRRSNITVEILQGRLPSVRAVLSLARLAFHFRPDLIHSHQRREALFGRVLSVAVGGRSVEHAHTLLPGKTVRPLSFLSNQIIAVSPEVEKMLHQRFRVPQSRITLALNAPPRRPGPSSVIASGEWGGDGLRVLGVGRLSPQKDPLRFVESIAELAKAVHVSAVWIGEGEMRAQAQELATTLDAPIRFPGRRDDVVDWMRSADVLLMTSGWEGLPLVALEALASELTVIAPAIDGMTTLLNADPAEPSGFLFREDADASEIAQTIRGVIVDDSRQRRAKSGRALVEKTYGRSRLCADIDRAYRKAMERNNAK